MPGFEIIGQDELEEISTIFTEGSGVLFRHSFDQLRNGVYKVKQFENDFKKYMGSKHALAVSSGSAALRVALGALEIGEGDEVITQAFTFVATAESIIEAKAKPVVVNIDETLNMDPEALEKAITKKTKAIIVVHMLGVPARMTEIKNIADKYSIPIIEDTAWGCGGEYDGKKLGTIGTIGTYSFDYAKAVTTGEGGMVVTNSSDIAFRASAYHDHGHENNKDVPRWMDTRHASGFNYRMSELQGAVGIVQLKKLNQIITSQREIHKKLQETVGDIKGVSLRSIPEKSLVSGDAFIFFLETPELALKVREKLVACGIGTKILPEAISWHFAGTWSHMKELVESHGADLQSVFARSASYLKRSVAIPILLNHPNDFYGMIYNAIDDVIN